MKHSTLYIALACGVVVCSMRQAAAGTPPACPNGKFTEDCNDQAAFTWGGPICSGTASVSSGTLGKQPPAPDGVAISIDASSAIWGEIQGWIGGSPVAGCIATDTTLDGTSATDTTGCGGLTLIKWNVRNCY